MVGFGGFGSCGHGAARLAGGGISIGDGTVEQAVKATRHSAFRARGRNGAPILPNGLGAPLKGCDVLFAEDLVLGRYIVQFLLYGRAAGFCGLCSLGLGKLGDIVSDAVASTDGKGDHDSGGDGLKI